MSVQVNPCLEVHRHSLYWKEALEIQTKALPSLHLELSEGATIGTLLDAVATSLSWQPKATLLRLPGFTEPWERALIKGRELSADSLVLEALKIAAAGQEGQPAAGAASHGLHITVVRRVLQADGWKIKPAGDFLSDSEDEDE